MKHLFTITLALLLSVLPSNSEEWETFFPEGLVNADGQKVSPSSLEGKIVCLYFSASWCGPCKGFTPTLIKFQKQYRDQIQVVLVSKDRSSESFAAYMTDYEMPWPAVPWANYKDKTTHISQLVSKYRAGGIPKLVVLSRDGSKVIEYNARLQIFMLPEEYAQILRERDGVRSADSWKRREEKKGNTVTDAEYTKRVASYKAGSLKVAEEYQQAYLDSLGPVTLNAQSEWLDFVHHYYHTLRAEK